MFTQMKVRTAAIAGVIVLAATTAGGIAVAGKGDGGPSPPSGSAQAALKPIPPSVLSAESGAEDTIDLALAGKPAQAVRAANELNRVAHGRAATDLAAAGISPARIAEFQTRAAKVAALAPTADPLTTALASNRVFELVSEFLSSYDDVVPSRVIRLDYLDFEAKLQALNGHRAAVSTAVTELASTWDGLHPRVVAAGGAAAAAAYSTHVAAMQDLVKSGDAKAIAGEAQHGLDLVDKIESAFTG
jgi:hypothetical protein